MQIGRLFSFQLTVPTHHNQSLQQVNTLSSNRLLLSFESSIEIWSITPLGLLKHLTMEDHKDFWQYIRPIDESNICFISQATGAELWTLNLEKVEKSCVIKLPKDVSIILDLFVFKKSKNLVVVCKRQEEQTVAITIDGTTKEQRWQNFGRHLTVSQYDSQGTLASFPQSKEDRMLSFSLRNSQANREYKIQVKKEEQMSSVLKRSATTCFIGCAIDIQQSSTVYIYSLEEQKILRQVRHPIPFMRILRTGFDVIGIAMEDLTYANSVLKAVEIQKYTEEVAKTLIPRHQYYWVEHYPLVLVKDTFRSSELGLTIVRWIPNKKKAYINFLQQTRILEDFGKEVVQEVLKNLE